MIKSMTGYGRSRYNTGSWNVVVEIKSVNHRYTDINIRASKQLMCIENEIKRRVQQKVARGKVDISISCEKQNVLGAVSGFNEEAFRAYVDLSKKLAKDYALSDGLNVAAVLSLPGVLSAVQDDMAEDKELLNIVLECTDIALDELAAMRINEGKNLYVDISKCLGDLRSIVDDIKEKASQTVKQYMDKLTLRMQELLSGTPIDNDRIVMEAAVYADKCDVNEEIARLYSHLDQFAQAIDSDMPVGRKLDFIAQEIYREFNTIASKATDVDIINCVIEAKAITEKIREQIQNIE